MRPNHAAVLQIVRTLRAYSLPLGILAIAACGADHPKNLSEPVACPVLQGAYKCADGSPLNISEKRQGAIVSYVIDGEVLEPGTSGVGRTESVPGVGSGSITTSYSCISAAGTCGH